jgi:8-oxo-dGTP diphosphatase
MAASSGDGGRRVGATTSSGTEAQPPVIRAFVDTDGRPVPYDGVSPVSWRVGAYALVVRGGRVLMVEPRHTLLWELPGGGVEARELLAEGAARECYEESGYRFIPDGAAPYHVGEGFVCWVPERGMWHVLAAVFRGTVEGDADPSWEADADEIGRVAWIDPAALTTENTHPNFWPVLRSAGLLS